MADIIKFPKKNTRSEQQTDVVQNLNILDEMIVDETFEILSASIVNHIGMAGFDFSKDDDTYKVFCLFMETLRSFVLKYYGKEHMFHPLAENCVELDGENVIYRHINFNFLDPAAIESGMSADDLKELEEYLESLDKDKKE